MPALKVKSVISVFDIIGPVMIGPSSSHTAGAAKIGYRAYQALEKLGEKPTGIKIKLYNSFSDTGKGHRTDLALLGGCLGLKPDDEKIIEAEAIAKKMGVNCEIKWGLHSNDFHPNTAVVKLRGEKEKITLIGYSVGGGLVQTFNKESFKPYQPGKNSQTKKYLSLNEIKKQVNTGRQLWRLILACEEKLASDPDYREFLGTLELDGVTNIKRPQISQEMFNRWQIMKNAINKGIRTRKRHPGQLFGDDANRILNSKLNVISRVIENGITYSIGTAEHNARMGKIVASPTAGSCGIVPGVMRAMQQKFHFQDHEIVEALMVAGGIGAITAQQVELAGAVAGCQAEIGVAGAMAAGAGAYLLGGNIQKIENAASLVLANLLGLTCDPIMGRVEVPCILRNGMVTSMVFSAIEMAMDGINYYIPYDEVVSVMKNIGQQMPEEYRETSTGGLATTKTACQFCKSQAHCLRN